jgi:hypothetical protein
MQYQSMEQIAGSADILAPPILSRRERLERWAELLEHQPARMRAIPGVEFGSRSKRNARRADGSPLAVAYADPVLRVAGLQGDRIGDAAAFFGLSHGQLHLLVCSCHHGGTVEPSAAAEYVRALARGAAAPTTAALVTGFAVSAGLATILACAALL